MSNIYTVNEHNLLEWRRGRREALEEAIQRLTEKLKEDFPESPLVNSGNEVQRLRAALEKIGDVYRANEAKDEATTARKMALISVEALSTTTERSESK